MDGNAQIKTEVGTVYVRDVLDILDSIAPFNAAEEWDNVGLLCGSSNDSVRAILCALDLSQATLDEASRLSCNMIVTHHPILFRGRKNLRKDDAEGRLLSSLVKADIALAALHTNLDIVHPGVNDALAAELHLHNVTGAESGMCVGTVSPVPLAVFTQFVTEQLHTVVRCYGDDHKIVQRVAVMGGAADNYIAEAQTLGADVFITGEAGYHKALEASWNGMAVLEAGHAATENPVIAWLAKRIQEGMSSMGWNIPVHEYVISHFETI